MHAEGVVTQAVALADGDVDEALGLGSHVAPTVLVGIGQFAVVVDDQRHLGEGRGIERREPLEYGHLVGRILVDHRVRFAPFTQSEGVDEVHMVRIVEILGQRRDEFGVFLLKDGIVGIGRLVDALARRVILGARRR